MLAFLYMDIQRFFVLFFTGEEVQGGANRETEGVTGDGEMKPETGEEVQGGTSRETEGVTVTGDKKLETTPGEEVQGGTNRETEGVTGDGEIKPETREEVQGGASRETEGVTGDGAIKPETESPKPVVIIKPDTQVFREETVTFRCEIQEGGETEWTYDWYRDNNTFNPSHTTQEFIISDYDSGEYTCRGRRSNSQISKTSDPVTLTVSAITNKWLNGTTDAVWDIKHHHTEQENSSTTASWMGQDGS
ncbi:uncharacterized protein LOC128610725 [Ictalurus furcatus]|uniref:uncharacterized protein LOC128610725 n=1 Tax=Ictalurus furcatus TaxID=66913 RepID=UPI00234FB82E|nr:uncharacterized protein LOC128610725 [Ictalurus furcatus]